ncbi:hypothetical protein ABPG75_011820 [Micractinium tetrahymenae]
MAASAVQVAPQVRIGGYDLATDRPGRDYERRAVARLWPHAKSARQDWSWDIAQPSSRRPAALPPYKRKPKLPLPAGTPLRVLGWGVLGNGSDADVLQEASV